MSQQLHLLLLAAGSGRRFASGVSGMSLPKQYVIINGQTVLEHSLAAFKNINLNSAVITVSPDDTQCTTLKLKTDFPLSTTAGGQTRAESVRLGLKALQQAGADDSDWVLVHDAARCCVAEQEIQELIQRCITEQRGGLLVNPIHDTLKYSTDGLQVDKTINREQVFAALTPQMFSLGELLAALMSANDRNISITDESSAMEAVGVQPLMIQGRASNIKLTRAEQLPQVEAFLSHNLNSKGE
ncbi:MAG: 2-C-methyl-D-erythritol 4-phosphate cytidylyltransferase [Proteobacteria bacterium]|nr:2-C-methyl-D-erythritol 4-phosphate cytidylyltransferase [Pseudomonadota bacterium]